MYIELNGRKITRLYYGLHVYNYLYSEKGQQENLEINYLAEGAYGRIRCHILLGHNNGSVKEILLLGAKKWDRYGEAGDLVESIIVDMSNVIVAMMYFARFSYIRENYMTFKAKFEKELVLYNNTTEDSLMNLCRTVVRQTLSNVDSLHDFDILPLPPPLKRYLHCYRGRWCNKGCEYCRFSWSKTIDWRKL